jgi:hypothetical protein
MAKICWGIALQRRDPLERHLLGFARPVNDLRCIEDFKTNYCAIFAEIHYDARPHLVAFTILASRSEIVSVAVCASYSTFMVFFLRGIFSVLKVKFYVDKTDTG